MLFSSRKNYSYRYFHDVYTVFHILSIIHELFYDAHVAAFIAEARLPHNDVNAKSLFI
jgi:hypothetical protein